MLGGGDLGSDLACHIRAVLLHQREKAVKLTGRDEGIDGIGEQQHIRIADGFQGGGEILGEGFDLLSNMENFKGVMGIFLLQIQDSLQCDAVFALGASVEYQNLHGLFS